MTYEPVGSPFSRTILSHLAERELGGSLVGSRVLDELEIAPKLSVKLD